MLTGCHSGDKPAREATLLHNKAIRAAVAALDEAVNGLDMRLTGFSAENWEDALAGVQTASIRLRSDVDELKRSLGYADVAETRPGPEDNTTP